MSSEKGTGSADTGSWRKVDTEASESGTYHAHVEPTPSVEDIQSAAVRADKPEGSEPHNSVPLVFACLMLGMLLSSLGQMIFSTALPTLVGDLGGVENMSWVITIFLMAMTIGMPIYGKMGDQVGRKPLYLFAVSVFIIGSIIGALAQNMTTMIVARGIQGVGGGGLMVLSQAIIADVVPARQRGKYMGLMGAVFGLSSVLGPLLGGFFTDGPGWRWALWFNVPIGIIVLIMTSVFLKLPKRGSGAKADIGGTITMAVATAAIILTATWGGRKYDWTSPTILILIAAAVVSAVLFVFIENRAESPLIPMHLFKVRNFVLTTAAGLIVGMTMFGSLGYLPTYIQMTHGMSPTRAGLMMIPMMAGMIVTSTVSGQYVTKTGNYKWFPVVGLLVTAAAMFFIGQLNSTDSLTHLGLLLALFGVGLGMVMQILVLIVQNAFPITMVGTATASNNFFRQIGGSLGAAVVGSIFTGRLTDFIGERLPAALKSMGPAGQKYAQAFAGGGGEGHLTPDAVKHLPDALRQVIVGSYNDALVPVLGWMAPAAVVAALILAFVRSERLKESVE